MHIIVFSDAGKKSLRLSLGPAALWLLPVSLLLLAPAIFLAGARYSSDRSAQLFERLRAQTESAWQLESAEHLEQLGEIRLRTEKSLDAMAGRLSLLQGHVMRLDALGSRLASMADLQDLEFGIDKPPGMGGPGGADSADEIGALSEPTPSKLPDLLAMLDTLELTLQDRSEKLTVMESMLIDRNLQEQTSPAGRPAKGGWLSSLYGYRTDPFSGKREFHQGIDIAGKPGTPVTAVAAGIVIWSGPRYAYGKLVEVDHGNGYITRYAHNQSNLVNVGQKVDKGEVIALMGNTGRSTGTHVHFEVLKHGKNHDPRKYLSLK